MSEVDAKRLALARMRLDYETAGLDVADLHANPVVQFERWFDEAVASNVEEPNATVVSTVDSDGQPWARYVLLKAVSDSGFVFYTNYQSAKSQQLSEQPKASLTFGWLEIHRQVNIAGTVERVSEADSDTYWSLRTRGSQLGGWASRQSSRLVDRDELEVNLAEVEQRFKADKEPIPRPSHWGGWRLVPHTIEFWQGRRNRLHDRLRYTLTDDEWQTSRLSP